MPEYLPSNGRLRAFRRVVMVDGVVSLASAELSAMGHVTTEGVSYGDGQPVHLREPGGKALVACDEPVSAGVELFAANEGKVSAVGSVLEGKTGSDSAGGVVELVWSDPAEPAKKKGK